MSTLEQGVPHRTLSAVVGTPLLLFALQIPNGLVEMVGRSLELLYPDSVWVPGLSFLPYMICGALSSSLTYAYLTTTPTPQKGGQVWRHLHGKFGKLAAVTTIASLICLVGIVALIVPAIYFMTVFYFYPQLIISEPELPWSVYLSRSKRIAKRGFFQVLGVVVFSLFVEFVTERLGPDIFGWLWNPSGGSFLPVFGCVLVQVFLSMVMSVTINVWSTYLFLKLKAEPR